MSAGYLVEAENLRYTKQKEREKSPDNTIGLTGRNKEADKHHKNGRAKGETGSKKQQHNGNPNERSNGGYHTEREDNQQEGTGSGKKNQGPHICMTWT
jgi:hypothetical protein